VSVITGSNDGTARIWDVGTGKSIRVLENNGSALLTTSYSPDGKNVLTASYDSMVRAWAIDYVELYRAGCHILHGFDPDKVPEVKKENVLQALAACPP
jgi:WD40 repeat protein